MPSPGDGSGTPRQRSNTLASSPSGGGAPEIAARLSPGRKEILRDGHQLSNVPVPSAVDSCPPQRQVGSTGESGHSVPFLIPQNEHSATRSDFYATMDVASSEPPLLQQHPTGEPQIGFSLTQPGAQQSRSLANLQDFLSHPSSQGASTGPDLQERNPATYGGEVHNRQRSLSDQIVNMREGIGLQPSVFYRGYLRTSSSPHISPSLQDVPQEPHYESSSPGEGVYTDLQFLDFTESHYNNSSERGFSISRPRGLGMAAALHPDPRVGSNIEPSRYAGWQLHPSLEEVETRWSQGSLAEAPSGTNLPFGPNTTESPIGGSVARQVPRNMETTSSASNKGPINRSLSNAPLRYGPSGARYPSANAGEAFVTQDEQGVTWLEFGYRRDKVTLEYRLRCDFDTVDVSRLSSDFRRENCVYPKAMVPPEEYQGHRQQYETMCNEIGWRLCFLNPEIRGKRGMIQRAVDSYRNTSEDLSVRSRRARRMARRMSRELPVVMSTVRSQSSVSKESAQAGATQRNISSQSSRIADSYPHSESRAEKEG